MHRRHIALFVLLAGCCSSLYAQQPDVPQAVKEHAFLNKFVGTWKSVADYTMAPGQPPMKTEATSKCRMIGKYWIHNEITSDGGGQTVTAIQTIGYDSEKKKYFGTWIDSMFDYMWRYEGTVSEDGTTMTLEAEGPNFMTGKGTAKFREIYEFKSPGHIVSKSLALDENGKWIEFANGNTRRAEKDNEEK